MSTQTVVGGRETVTPAAAGAESGAKPRLLYLDNLRTAAITLVVLGHVAVSYGAEGDWYLHGEGQASPLAFVLMLPLMAIGAAFMMGLLFLIAGYFTPRSYDRKGPGPFLVDRLKRLGIPLLLFAIVINPIIEYLVEAHTGEFQGSYWSFIPPYIRNLDTAGFGVTWFLEALLIFSIFYILWRLLTQSSPQRNAPNSGAVPSNRSIALFALVLGFATFLVRIWAPVNKYFEPEHLEFAHFPQYVAMFAVGTVAYRRNWLATILRCPGQAVALGGPGLCAAAARSGGGCGGVDRRARRAGRRGAELAVLGVFGLGRLHVPGDGHHGSGLVPQAVQSPGPAGQGDVRVLLCRVRPPSDHHRAARAGAERHSDQPND